MAVQLSPECKVQLLERALHNALLEPKSRVGSFLKSVSVSKSFLRYSHRFYVYSFAVVSFSAERSTILIGKYGNIRLKDLQYKPVSTKQTFSHQRALKLIKTFKPPLVVLGLSQNSVTTQELEQYSEVLREVNCKVQLIFDENPDPQFFLPLVQPIAKQISFIDCESLFLTESLSSNRLDLNLCVCHNVQNIGQVQQVLKHNVKHLVLDFNWGQFSDAIKPGGEIVCYGENGENMVCNSLEYLELDYQADPDDMITIMSEIKEFCPNLKYIFVKADFESSSDFIRDFNNRFFEDIRSYINFAKQLFEFCEQNPNIVIFFNGTAIFHLTFDSLANPQEAFAQLEMLERFKDYKAVDNDAHIIYETSLFGEEQNYFNFKLKVVQYKPMPNFFSYYIGRAKQFFRGLYQSLLRR